MRQLETFPNEADARTVADAMYADGIETTVSATREGAHALWVHDDARLDDARAWLGLFREDPGHRKIVESVKVARDKRRAAEKRDRATEKRVQSARRDLERRTGIGTASLFFVLAAVGVYAVAQLQDAQSVLDALAFAGPTATHAFDSIAHGEVWRLVTPSFITGNLFSLFFSSIFLLMLGSAFEHRHRSRAMVALGLTAAAASNALVAYAFGPGYAGSIHGIYVAVFAYLFVRHRLDPREWDVPPGQTALIIPIFFVVNLVIPSFRPYAYMDVAGFIVGGVAAILASRVR